MPPDCTFAIVTPSYNTGKHIGAAVRSVLEQSGCDVNYVVMDGGSTDDTVEVLKSFGPRLRWVSERDRGQADAINRGFAQTRGDILGWLNSDDAYALGALRAAAEFLAAHPDIAMVYGDADFIDAAGDHIARCAHVEPVFSRRRLLHYSDFIVQPAAFFRRSAFEAVGGLDPSLNWAMDYDLWLKFADAGFKVAYLPRVLANYRWLGGSKSAAGGWGRLKEVDAVARRHGARRTPAYFRLERVNMHLTEARQALRHRDVGSAAASFGRATGNLLSSPRAMWSLLSPRTWRVIYTGQVLRKRAGLKDGATGTGGTPVSQLRRT
jgi:glycosyltransferase involved in cell wall biosynthesis